MSSRRETLRAGLRGPVPTPASSPGAPRRIRPAWVEVDLGAIRDNVAALRQMVAPAALCAVVKADGYGHGAPAVASAALAGGAAGLAVALVEEGIELRQAHIGAPVLLLSEPPGEGMEAAVAAGVTPTVCTPEGVARVGAAARALGRRVAVHVKVDTGMHRVGAHPDDLGPLVAAVRADPALTFEGLWTHLAVADGTQREDQEFTEAQLDLFEAAVHGLPGRDHAPGWSDGRPRLLHAANSAGALCHPRARYDLVRCGIAVYGELPNEPCAAALGAAGLAVRPALSLRARVAALRELPAGARPSYGRLRPLATSSTVATVPLGYADGIPRALFGTGFEVLIKGRRRPLAGMVTMDQIVVDCGPDRDVAVGDEVVLLGRQGDQEITAAEWARRLGTISYEILCGIGPRVPRQVVGGSAPGSEEGGGPRLTDFRAPARPPTGAQG